MANGKKKPMSRTSGVARRLLGRSEGIATKLKYGAPLTGSASGVKSISLKDAGEVLTSGIVTLGKKGLQADPASLAMALPVGKVLKAAQALKAAGKIKQATALIARVDAKRAGQVMGEFGNATQGVYQGRPLRRLSESVFPRAAGGAESAPTLRQEYETVKQGYEQVFGKGKKVSSFNPDVAAMTGYPGRGGSVAKIRKISNQVDAYLKKRGGKTIGK